MTLTTILLLCAVLCFLLDAFGVPSRVKFSSLAWALVVLGAVAWGYR